MKNTQSRMTKQRKVILEELRRVTSHPTAEEIYLMVRERMPHVSLGTVYRNLDVLAASGEILQLNSGGSVRRFDGLNAPHCHVRCLNCGRVGDVELEHAPSLAAIRAQAAGFSILSSKLEFEGICAHCSANRSTRPADRAALPATCNPGEQR